MPTKVCITGGCGFLGSHLVDRILKTTDWHITILDRFTYASAGLQRLKEIGAYPDNDRVKIHVVDISRPMGKCLESEIGHVDFLVHLAAGSHVDRSIACPREFIESNVIGTFEMLEYARRIPNLKKFLYFSTDEVMGPAAEGQKFKEDDRTNPCNPYAACKSAGEDLTLAWANTYNVPVILTRCMNIMGERQHKEKYIPRVVRAALDGSTILVHTDPLTKLPGSRNYFHAQDVADAVLFLLNKNVPLREKYNIAGTQEVSNLDVVLAIEGILRVPISYKKVNPTDVRPGFDVRYGLNGEKMATLGWVAPHNFEKRLREVVEWMVMPQNQHWLRD